MQVTIDSTESLDEVLSVLSTMFGTRIVTDPAETVTTTATVKPAPPATPAKTAKPAKATTPGKSATGSKRSASSAPPTVDASAVRAWARDTGVAVSVRGAVSKSLIAAYQAAQA